jgi:sugar phosphate isomerase/epimerase
VREIIDAVQPTRSFYTLETMPWMYPDSPESYLRLMEAIGRPALAAHLDPVNLVSSPQLYFNTGALITACFDAFGPQIKSCHAKDILLHPKLTVHLDEVRPGLGELDYVTFLRLAHATNPDMPVMLEHLSSAEDYQLAADYVRSVAVQAQIPL